MEELELGEPKQVNAKGFSQSIFELLTGQVSDPQAQSGNPTLKIEMGSVNDLPQPGQSMCCLKNTKNAEKLQNGN